jgi:hypothetical protein
MKSAKKKPTAARLQSWRVIIMRSRDLLSVTNRDMSLADAPQKVPVFPICAPAALFCFSPRV